MRDKNRRLRQLADLDQFDEDTLALLFRAINTKRLIAFLGSGISAPYGAMSWRQFVDRVHEEAMRRLGVAAKGARPEYKSQIESIRKRMNDLRGEKGSRAESVTSLLEFYKLAFELSAEARDDLIIDGAPQEPNFHQYIASMFLSDRLHAEDLMKDRVWRLARSIGLSHRDSKMLENNREGFLDALHRRLDKAERKASKEESVEQGGEPRSRSIRNGKAGLDLNAVYGVETFKLLQQKVRDIKTSTDIERNDALKEQREAIDGFLEKLIDIAAQFDSKTVYPVDRRSALSVSFAIVGVFFATFADKKTSKKLWKELEDRLLEACRLPQIKTPTGASDPFAGTSSAGEMRPSSDPIAALYQELAVWRFLTTNYDREVERLLEHINHARGTLADRYDTPRLRPPLYRRDGVRRASRGYLGELSTTDALTPDSVAGLIDIASSEHLEGAQIFHVHGRADEPHTIIASEGDYQRLYLEDSPEAASLRVAQSLVFSGNPVLFVGSGLSEQDLQRPLREFVSQNPNVDRDLFALMPADKPPNERLRMKVENYLRYGVRTIFYGERRDATSEQAKDLSICTLSHDLYSTFNKLNDLTNTLKTIQSGAGAPDTPDDLGLIANKLKSLKGPIFDDNLLGTDGIDRLAWSASADLFDNMAKVLGHNTIEIPKPAFRGTLEAIVDYVTQLQGRLISGALERAIMELSDQRAIWWENVLYRPETRRTSKMLSVGPDACPMKFYARHPLVLRGPMPDGVSETVKQFANALSPASGRATGCRVILAESAPGAGKASHYYALVSELISRANTAENTQTYSHALFLNLAHSLEFSSSVIAAANTMKLLLLDDLYGGEEPQPGLDNETMNARRDRIGHLAFLEWTLQQLREKHTGKHRALILVGGLDRLVTAGGRYRSQEVRSFIQILASSCGDDLPVDVVFVSRRLSQWDRLFSYEVNSARKDIDPHVKAGHIAKEKFLKIERKDDNVKAITVWYRSFNTDDGRRLSMAELGERLRDEEGLNPRPLIVDLSPKRRMRPHREDIPQESAWARLESALSDVFYLRTIALLAYNHVHQRHGTKDADRWATKLYQAVHSASRGSRSDRVIQAVLFAYGMTSEEQWRVDLDRERRLEAIVLQHLTFFGYPVEGHVLIRAPNIRKYLTHCVRMDGARSKKKEPTADEIRQALEKAISRLLERRLISVLDHTLPDVGDNKTEKGDGAEWVKATLEGDTAADHDRLSRLNLGCRYALHPLVRQHLLKNTAISVPDESHVNTFVFTLHATQPTDVCLLAPDMQAVADELVGELIQAWRTFKINEEEFKKLRARITDANLKVEGRAFVRSGPYFWRARTVNGILARASADMPACFRAAYGVLRQLRPFSVLARMQKPAPYGPSDQSIYEHTDERLRDLLRGIASSQIARALVKEHVSDIEKKEIHLRTFGPTIDPAPPLFPHELAWLWNERGVIALAQGRLYDAVPYFAEAKEQLAKHEGGEGRSTTIRIDINLAATWIERGNLRRADEAFTEAERKIEEIFLRTSPKDMLEDYLITRPICWGYQGLAAHLAGDRVTAEEKYTTAIDLLRKLSRNRAIATFLRHRADLKASQRDFDGARQDLSDAKEAAEGLQQLDLVHAIYLSEVKMDMERAKCGVGALADCAIDAKIDIVKRYAREMGLYRHLCESLAIEAQYRAELRDYEAAKALAAESLALATRHGMTLRRLNAKSLLGKLFIKMKDEEAGVYLLNRARESGQRIGYNRLVRTTFEATSELF